MWYDMDSVKTTESEPIEAETIEEATRLAYAKYNGKPPAPLLYLEEIQCN